MFSNRSCVDIDAWGGFEAIMPSWATYIGQQTFLTIIDIGNSDFTLGNIVVIVDIVGQVAHI